MNIISHTGIGKRNENQDLILISELQNDMSLYLVVDGMGGYENGFEAAKIIIEEARIYLSKLSNNNIFNMDQQLKQIEDELGDLIKYFGQEDKGKIASKLKSLKIIIQGLESEYIRNFLQNILEIIENYNKNRSKKSFDKKEGFKNFKASIKSGFSGLRKLL